MHAELVVRRDSWFKYDIVVVRWGKMFLSHLIISVASRAAVLAVEDFDWKGIRDLVV